MDAKYSQEIREVLSYSKEEALRLGNDTINIEHLFLGILKTGEVAAVKILTNMGVDLTDLQRQIEEHTRAEINISSPNKDNFPLMKETERVLRLLYLEARYFNEKEINTAHLLLAIMREGNNIISKLLKDKNIEYDEIKMAIIENEQIRGSNLHDEDNDENDTEDDDDEMEEMKTNISKSNSNTPVLDNFGIDLTKAAEDDTLDPIVGRNTEIERLVQILSRRKKNNPVLIGEPGVGKSAIAEGLAIRIVQKKVSRVLFDKRIVALDLAAIVAGTKYRGQFEERMKSIINELSKNNKIILFIDEIHTMVGAGGASGSLDAANMLKPALARGEIQCIGATTLDEYRQHIEKDGALERRFQKIMVEPTTTEETQEILHNIKERYEDHHNVRYTDDAIRSCVMLTNRYITDRLLPDKAIDALDEAGARVHISNIKVPEKIDRIEKAIEDTREQKISAVKSQNFELAANFRDKEQEYIRELDQEKKKWEQELLRNRETVEEAHVEEVVAMMTGVPVQRIAQEEGVKLLKMKKELGQKIIGQEEAVRKIVRAIQRNRAGLKDPNKPIGTFIFSGPTGVGKTQLAKILAQYLFDSSDALIRIDMSEYMEKFSVSRLVGAPPGYVGYEEGGQLTEKVRRRPYSVVLLDEIEKSHQDVFNILLQVLDEGQLTDSLGRKVDFRNTIVIMTSNVGTRELKEIGRGIGFETANSLKGDDYKKSILDKEMKKRFAPEFLNRVDEIIAFNSLSRDDIYKIIDIELNGLYNRVTEQGYKLVLTKEAKDFIVDKGYDPKYGARPLKRAIQKYLEDEMAEVIIEASIIEGDVIEVSLDESKDKININILQKNKEDTKITEEKKDLDKSRQD